MSGSAVWPWPLGSPGCVCVGAKGAGRGSGCAHSPHSRLLGSLFCAGLYSMYRSRHNCHNPCPLGDVQSRGETLNTHIHGSKVTNYNL